MNNLYQAVQNNGLYQELMNIKERPPLYIGTTSFKKLSGFIIGYYACVYRHNVTEEIDILNLNKNNNYECDFGRFVCEKYNLGMNYGWEFGIEHVCPNDKEALYLFYKLLDEYIKISIDNKITD